MPKMYHSLTVALERDLPEEVVEKLKEAILQFRGVSAVTTAEVRPGEFAAEMRVRKRIMDAVLKEYYEKGP